jgi:hypothetical protein
VGGRHGIRELGEEAFGLDQSNARDTELKRNNIAKDFA